jgi:TonB family protein
MRQARFHLTALMDTGAKQRGRPNQEGRGGGAAAAWITVAVAALYWLNGARTGSLWPLPSSTGPEPPPPTNFTIRMPANLDFGSQPVGGAGTTANLVLEVTAAGPVPLTVEPATLSDPESTDFTITQDLCGGAKLSAQQTCTIVVGFNPKVEGAHTGLLTVKASPLDHPLQTMLRGTATPPVGTLDAVLPPRLDFGSLRAGGDPVTRELKLEVNGEGSTPLAVQAATLSDSETSDFTISHDGCAGTQLAAGQSCTIQVAFDPMNNGAHVTLLTVPTSLAGRPLQTELRGTVTPPAPVHDQTPVVVDQPTMPPHVHPGGQVTEAVAIYAPPPPYPPDAIRGHREGTVVLSAVITKQGSVRDVKAESGDPMLAAAAVRAVSRWRYRPTLLNGQPIDDTLEITVKFALKPPANPQQTPDSNRQER